METFYINNFYKTLREFLVNLRKTYPELKEDLDNYYIYIKKTKKKKFIKKFMNNLQPYAECISKNDESIFKKNEQVNILRNIDFSQIFKRTNDSNKKIIWQYLQSLYILGNFILNAGDIVKQLGSINTEKTENSESKPESELGEGANILKSMLDNMKNTSTDTDSNTTNTANTENEAEGASKESQENPFGFIEDLAKEIAADIKVPEGANPNNPGELLQSLLFSKDGGGFSNIISNVSEKIKTKFESGELNEEKIMKQTQSMMGNLSKQFGANMPDMSKDGAMNEENFGKMMQGMTSMLGGLGGGGGGGGLGNLASMFGSMMGGGNDDEMPDLDEMIKKNKKGGVDYRANLKREKLRQKLKERQTERMNKIKGINGDKEEKK